MISFVWSVRTYRRLRNFLLSHHPLQDINNLFLSVQCNLRS